MIKVLLFDFGDTLIRQVVDNIKPLNDLDTELLPGVSDALNNLKNHYRMAILSNTEQTTKDQLILCLEKLHLKDLNIEVFTSVSLGFKKPDPRAFKIVMQTLNVAPEELVMIGNDINEDIFGSRALNIPAIYISENKPMKDQIDSLTLWHKSVSDITVDSIKLIESLIYKRHSDEENIEDLAKGYKEKAIEVEKKQDWRMIAYYWSKCAEILNPYNDEVKVEFHVPDKTIHHFPHISRSTWNNLSRGQRAARAFRYAGYYYDEDGEERRTNYAWYRASGKCYEKEKIFDEASRSHYLAAITYVQRFGEINEKYLQSLEKTTKVAVSAEPESYLHRMIIYYRRLGAELRTKGNHKEFIRLRKMRNKSQVKLLFTKKEYVRAIIMGTWNILTDYSQSIIRWIGLYLTFAIILFPILYLNFAGIEPNLSVYKTIIFSLSRSVSYTPYNVSLNELGNIFVIIQSILSLLWLGAAIAIIVNRSQE